MRRLLAAAALTVAAIGLFASPAGAHAVFEGSDPAPDSELPAGEPPAAITIEFSEGVQVVDDSIRLLDGNGTVVDGVGDSEHGAGDEIITATLPDLDDGSYVVDWHVVSQDSHPITGAFTFSVGTPTADSDDIAGLLEGDTNRGVGITFGLTRALAFASVLTLIGALFFLWTRWPEAGRDPGQRGLLWVSWIVAFVTAFAGIALQAAYSSGQTISGALDTGAIGDVMDTRFGQSWLVRAFLLLLALPWLRRPERVPRPPVAGLATVLGVALLATFTFAGHARTGRWTTFATMLDLFHLGGAAIWLGGVVVLVVALTRRVMLRGAVDAAHRFSAIAPIAIAVIVASGFLQGLRQTDGLESIVDTAYGRLLLVKVGLVGLVLTAASVSRAVLRGREETRAREPLPVGPGAARVEAEPELVRDLRDSVIAEVAIAALVLAVTAVLVNTTPARVANEESAGSGSGVGPVPAAGFEETLTDEDMSFEVSLSPALSGTNELTIVVTRDGAAFEPIEISATMAEETRGLAPIAIALTPVGDGTYVGTVSLPFTGEWTLQIDALRSEIDQATVSAAIDIG
ncbi:MAG: FixH family protein [Acidimicrobiia bacterium]